MQHLGTLTIANRKIYNFDFDPTGNFLFLITEHDLVITTCSNFELLGIIQPPTQSPIAIFNFSAAWNIVLLTTQNTIWIYSIISGRLILRIGSPDFDSCTGATFSADGRFLATVFNDGNYKLYKISPSLDTEIPPQDAVLNIDNYNFPQIINSNKYLNFDLISEEHYEQAIVSVSFSSGCEFIALGFENGKAVIRSTDTQPPRQWLIDAYASNSEVSIYFNPHNSFSFMTSGQKNGQIDFYTLIKNQRQQKKKNEDSDADCYRTFKVENRLRIVTSDFNCDGTILFGASTKKLFAWRTDDGTVINKMEFEQNVEIDCFNQVLPSLIIPEMALIIAKSSLWTWNCYTNEIHSIVIQGYHDPLFQYGLWFKSKTAMIKMNTGAINIYGCENQKWNIEEIHIDQYNGQYSDKIKNMLNEYEVNQLHRNMQIYEKRALQYFSEGYVAPDLRSSSDFDSGDFGFYGKKYK